MTISLCVCERRDWERERGGGGGVDYILKLKLWFVQPASEFVKHDSVLPCTVRQVVLCTSASLWFTENAKCMRVRCTEYNAEQSSVACGRSLFPMKGN